jgi:hypothetical protein
VLVIAMNLQLMRIGRIELSVIMTTIFVCKVKMSCEASSEGIELVDCQCVTYLEPSSQEKTLTCASQAPEIVGQHCLLLFRNTDSCLHGSSKIQMDRIITLLPSSVLTHGSHTEAGIMRWCCGQVVVACKE